MAIVRFAEQRREVLDVLPKQIAGAVSELRFWFVIGGQAVRCFCPYRPSHDVDFGVSSPKELAELVQVLARNGRFEILEREQSTVHGNFEGIDVSIFVLRELVPFTEDRVLTLTGLLATKLHAILSHGTRRDFFDLYVLLERHQLGVVECLRALRLVYAASDVNEGLVLRALSHFDDAEHEAALPGEGKDDFAVVKKFFRRNVSALLVPSAEPLLIATQVVDVRTPQRRKTTRRAALPKRLDRKKESEAAQGAVVGRLLCARCVCLAD